MADGESLTDDGIDMDCEGDRRFVAVRLWLTVLVGCNVTVLVWTITVGLMDEESVTVVTVTVRVWAKDAVCRDLLAVVSSESVLLTDCEKDVLTDSVTRRDQSVMVREADALV